VNVYFYAPADCAGKTLSFQVYGNAVSVRFIGYADRRRWFLMCSEALRER